MKNSTLKKLFALSITAGLLMTTAHTQTTTALDDNVLNYMKHNNVPGLSLALIRDGKISLTKGYGLANIDKDIPFTPNTIMSAIASVSKNITATAIMQLWERDSFELNDPINNYLPFAVTNPRYPSVPITFRMLLNHTSSIVSNDTIIEHPLANFTWVSPGTGGPLGVFLQSFLVPGGSLYYAYENYMNFTPGTRFAYSNIAYALLGYLVEKISGIPFDEYCDLNIFQPLCMNNTSWYYSGVDSNIVARPYEHTPQNYPYDLYERQDYPCGQLKTTAVELSKFLLMHMNFGILNGVRIIDSTTEVLMRVSETTEITTPDFRMDYTLGFQKPYWFGTQTTYFGHVGVDHGVGTASFANLTDTTGIIIFQNVDEFFTAGFPLYFYLDSLVDTMSTAGMLPLNCSYLFNPCEQNADYWKNNTSQWAPSAEKMKLGTKHYYSKNQTLALFNRPVNGDASILLTKSLIAAKLNLAQGSELSPVLVTYTAAMNILGDKRLPYDNPVPFSSPIGIQMLALAATLDSYNSGDLNTMPCSGSQAPITRMAPVNEVDKAALSYSLSVFPNPSSGNTTISFSLVQTEKVSIKVFDMSGRLVNTWADKIFEKGEHRINWNTDNMDAGIYFIKMKTADFSESRKLVVAN